MQLEEILPKLTEWFAPEEHKDRTLPGGGRWFYIPHQSITQRLNAVCPGHWHTKVNSTNIAGDYTVVIVELSICGVTRTGIGDDKTFPELNDNGKAKIIGTPPVRAFRSAFKDAAEQFGICAYLDDQKAKRNEFAQYMAKKGDQRANKFITENGWVEQPKEKPEPIGRDSLMKSTKSQLDRLKWTSATEAEYLSKTFGVESRTQLSNNQLSSFLGYLKSLELPINSPKLSSVSSVEVAPLSPPVLDRNLINAEIDSLLKRKNISVKQAQDALDELLGVRSRQHLSDNQLTQFLDYLKSTKEVTTIK
ncbi:Rad52/Rad22 family DNA repair protein [Nostoc sp.]|uniref:Rad52/Rad22 family DNA repair protein n=1 Tax=Nostoc sp. TaxID=1180 RepID=UPI002FF4CE49